MTVNVTFDEKGLAVSGRGASRYWGVGKNSASGNNFYVVADLEREDGEIRTSSYRPYKHIINEIDAAMIATKLFERGRPFDDGTEFSSIVSPDAIKYRIEGRFIQVFDVNTGVPLFDDSIKHKSSKHWDRRQRPDESKTPTKSPVTPPRERMSVVRPTSTNNNKPSSFDTLKDRIVELEEYIGSKLTDDEMVIVNAFIEDKISGSNTISPAVKSFIKNLL